MLSLVNVQKPGITYPLLVDQKYVVGRKQGDITFPEDQSVSRIHAELIVEHPSGNINEPLLTPSVRLTDVGSKFGTFATEENIKSKLPVNARDSITLAIGDRLRFGLQWNEFRVDYTPFVITTSSVKATGEFKDRIVKLGGHYVNEWNVKVTHLVMESLTLTVKAVCALLAAKPIVTSAYIENLLSCIQEKKDLPSTNQFLPTITEKGMTSMDESTFYPNTARTTLFAGKTFLFCTAKHLKKLAAAIEAGGGSTKLVADVQNENILSSEYIIMGHTLDVQEGQKDGRIRAVLDKYKRGGKRIINDSEIGLAAVHNSIEKHCNPKYSIASAVLPHLTTQTQSSSADSVPIVPETQDLETHNSTNNGNDSTSVVDETFIKEEDGVGTHFKRGEKRVNDQESRSSKKRVAEEVLSRSDTKRVKEVPSSSAALSASTRSLRSQKSSNEQKLKAIFNFSSSDEDDDGEVSKVPESQPDHLEDDDDAEVIAIPESQPDDEVEMQVPPDPPTVLVNADHARNLQPIASTSGSSTVGQSEIFRMPSTLPATESSVRNLHKSGTDFIQTVTESVMNAKTVPIPASANLESVMLETDSNAKHVQASKIKINESSITEAETSRKRRRDGDDVEAALVENTKKINLGDVKKEPGTSTKINTSKLHKMPLVNKNHSLEISALGTNESSANSNRRNFKVFKKVLPIFKTPKSSLVGQENSKSSNATPTPAKLNESRAADSDSTPVKFKPRPYTPGGKRRYKPGFVEDLHPALVTPDRGLRNGETDHARDAGNDRRREGNERTENLLSRTREIMEDNEQPGTSTGRRASPRKKGPAIKLARPPPPPLFAEEKMDDDDDDDEVDIWAFNR